MSPHAALHFRGDGEESGCQNTTQTSAGHIPSPRWDGEHKAQCSTQERALPGHQEPWGHSPAMSQREVHGRKVFSLNQGKIRARESISCAGFSNLLTPWIIQWRSSMPCGLSGRIVRTSEDCVWKAHIKAQCPLALEEIFSLDACCFQPRLSSHPVVSVLQLSISVKSRGSPEMLRSCPLPSARPRHGGDSAGFRQPPARTHRALPGGLLLSPRAASHPKHGLWENTGCGGQGNVSIAGVARAGGAKLWSPSVPALGPSLATGKP